MEIISCGTTLIDQGLYQGNIVDGTKGNWTLQEGK
jgi:hypothetical protein